MQVNILVKSKNLKSLLKNLNLIYNFFNKKLLNLNNKTLFKKLKFKTSLLKSPHVNKTAQQHFNYKIYKTNYFFNLYNKNKILFLLKNNFLNIFHDINTNLKIINNSIIKTNKSIILKKFLNIKYNNIYMKTNKIYLKINIAKKINNLKILANNLMV